jgi:hypothetical protein
MRFSSAIKKLKNSFGNGASCGPFSGQKTIRLPAKSHILSQGHTTNKRNIGFRARMHFLNGLTNWYPPPWSVRNPGKLPAGTAKLESNSAGYSALRVFSKLRGSR